MFLESRFITFVIWPHYLFTALKSNWKVFFMAVCFVCSIFIYVWFYDKQEAVLSLVPCKLYGIVIRYSSAGLFWIMNRSTYHFWFNFLRSSAVWLVLNGLLIDYKGAREDIVATLNEIISTGNNGTAMCHFYVYVSKKGMGYVYTVWLLGEKHLHFSWRLKQFPQMVWK